MSGSAWSTLHSLMNFSFAGFTNDEIYGHKWRIIPRTMSTNISVDPEYIDEILYHVGAMYGPPLNKGKCGCIFKSSDPMATITIYTTTSVISVQGSQHQAWVDSVLPEINARIDSESSLHHSTAINCESVSIQMDSDNELVLPSPITSTPKPTERSSAVSIGTQTPSCLCLQYMFSVMLSVRLMSPVFYHVLSQQRLKITLPLQSLNIRYLISPLRIMLTILANNPLQLTTSLLQLFQQTISSPCFKWKKLLMNNRLLLHPRKIG